MRGLALFIMRGRSQAVLAATVTCLLSLLVPMLSILSSAVIGLVTLRQGPQQGLVTMVLAALAAGAIGALSFGNPLPVLIFGLMLWLPIWGLGGVLRMSRSLALTLQVALGFGLLLIAADYLRSGDPVGSWVQVLEPLRQQFVEAQMLTEAQSQAFVQRMASWMTGVLATGFFLQIACSLFLARWWQALLYNPGGFREEFHRLRFFRLLGYLSVPLIGLLLVQGDQTSGPVRHLAVLLLGMFLLQGLAVAHGLLAGVRAAPAWLIGLYTLLVLAMPHAELVLAGIGISDLWFDFRARVAGRAGPGG